MPRRATKKGGACRLGRKVVKRSPKIRGTFCERTENPLRKFDRRSLRWKRNKKHWVLVGCPKGKWKPRAQRCAVGTRAYKLLVSVKK